MAIDLAIDIRTLVTINLVVQLALIVLVFGAVYLARRGRVKRHCAIQRGTVTVQIILILSIMLPSLLGYIENVPSIPLFYPELLVHHSLGLILVGMWVYINLEVERVIRPLIKRKTAMRIAFGVWLVAIALGVNIYLTIYTSVYP